MHGDDMIVYHEERGLEVMITFPTGQSRIIRVLVPYLS